MAVQGRMLINGQWRQASEVAGKNRILDIRAPYNGRVIGSVPEASQDDINEAVTGAVSAFNSRPLSPFERFEILAETSRLLNLRKEKIARILSEEAGKPIRDSRIEVSRAVQTFLISAEEAKRIHGEGVPVEASPGSENRIAFTMRVPIGVICAITPFNFPLNLTAHKVGPAIAAGNSVVLKPSDLTPFTAIALGEIMMESGLPAGYLNIIFGTGSRVGELLLKNPQFSLYTFTGSRSVGKRILETIGVRRSILELGSNSATIIHRDANIEKASSACVRAAFAYAGQVCISLQRIVIHKDVRNRFLDLFVPAVDKLRLGNPLDEETDVGPMISEEAAIRAEEWISEARSSGAEILTGGKRQGNMLEPAVLASVDRSMKIVCNEVFAPIVSIQDYDSIEQAIDIVNDSEFGLQSGVFTSDIHTAFSLARAVQSGGIIVNDTSMYRADAMPYGGVKSSGIGREGPRYTIEEMTDLKIIVFNL